MTFTIYHNPRCSKSRQTLALLQDNGIEPEIVEYLKNGPDSTEIKALLTKLGVPVREIIRSGEAAYKENGLSDSGLSEQQLIEKIVENPILLQRPIVVSGERAVIGRPPENVLGLL